MGETSEWDSAATAVVTIRLIDMGARYSHNSSSSNPDRHLLEEPQTDRQDVRATVTIAPDINIHRDSFQLQPDGRGCRLQLVYSAKTECVLQAAIAEDDSEREGQKWTHEIRLPQALGAQVAIPTSLRDVAAVLQLSPLGVTAQRQVTHLTLLPDPIAPRVRLLKQQLIIGDKVLMIHDIYGAKVHTLHEDEQLECVVCMTEPRCAIVLPCRHLCLCMTCSNVMRSQGQPKCPMCRSELEAVVQVAITPSTLPSV